VIDLAAIDIINELFGIGDSARCRGEGELGEVFLHRRHLFHVRDRVLRQADLFRELPVKALAGGEQGARPFRADGADHEGRDRRRGQAQAHFGEADRGILHHHADITGRQQTGPAAHRRTMDQGHGHLRQFVELAQHVGERQRVFLIIGLGIEGGGLHPVQIGAGGEALAGPAQEDDPHPVLIRPQRLEHVRQGRNHFRIEGIVLVGTVQRDHSHTGRADIKQDGIFLGHGDLLVGVSSRSGLTPVGKADNGPKCGLLVETAGGPASLLPLDGEGAGRMPGGRGESAVRFLVLGQSPTPPLRGPSSRRTVPRTVLGFLSAHQGRGACEPDRTRTRPSTKRKRAAVGRQPFSVPLSSAISRRGRPAL
jgi:hypothetical protein